MTSDKKVALVRKRGSLSVQVAFRPSVMMCCPPQKCRASGGGRPGEGITGREGARHSRPTTPSRTGSVEWASGWEKDNPNKYLEDIFAKHTKINHCPTVALTFVGSDTQHDRLEGEDERRAGEGGRAGVNKSHCHSSRSCVHVCDTCVRMFIFGHVSAGFVSCPLRLNVGKRPSSVVMADQALCWRPHAAVGETGQMSGQDLRYRSAN